MADDDMALPPGRTCADCTHFMRCLWLIGCRPSNVTCDWSPSRFVATTGETAAAVQEHEEQAGRGEQ